MSSPNERGALSPNERGNERAHSNRVRAESFGSAAETYDRVRPSYPPALVDDLLAGATLDGAPRADRPVEALDVGCGTGIAARLLADRGVTVLGVEADARMAEIARGHGIPVEVGAFEDWDPAGRRFDLIVSGQAWHWIDPIAGTGKAIGLLRPGGLFAPFWNFATLDAGVRARVDAAYARHAPQLTEQSVLRGGGPATIPPAVERIRASGLFASVEHRRYPWDCAYTRDEWLAMIGTHSDHSTLPAGQLSALLDAVGAAIGEDGVRAHYVTEAIFARVG